MADDTITIPKATDRQILSFFGELQKSYAFVEPTIRVLGSDEGVPNGGEGLLTESGSKTIRSVSASKPNAIVTFQRGAYRTQPNGQAYIESSY